MVPHYPAPPCRCLLPWRLGCLVHQDHDARCLVKTLLWSLCEQIGWPQEIRASLQFVWGCCLKHGWCLLANEPYEKFLLCEDPVTSQVASYSSSDSYKVCLVPAWRVPIVQKAKTLFRFVPKVLPKAPFAMFLLSCQLWKCAPEGKAAYGHQCYGCALCSVLLAGIVYGHKLGASWQSWKYHSINCPLEERPQKGNYSLHIHSLLTVAMVCSPACLCGP